MFFLALLLLLPTGFNVRTQFGKVCHIPKERLPWQIYSPDERFRPALVHAVNSWNRAGQNLGMGLLYEIAGARENADLTVDWSGDRLESARASAVWWDAGLGYVRVLGLTMDGKMNVPMGNFAQILMHEMGHPLGLEHSDAPQDIMFASMHTRRYHRVEDAQLTPRDVEALGWLYQQTDYVPIRGARETTLTSPGKRRPSSPPAAPGSAPP